MTVQPMDEDLERAGPSMDSQRDEQVRGKGTQSSTTTSAEDAALVDAWTHRLQMLTLVTTFLASIDGELFSLTNAQTQVTVTASTKSEEFIYSCFAGALIFHVCASILGYVASFALIRYQFVDTEISEKRKEQSELLSPGDKHGKHPLSLGPISPFDAARYLLQAPLTSSSRIEATSRTFSAPLPLLTRCYNTTLVLSGAGFIAALLGITAYAWERLQQTVGIFTVACLGVNILAGVWAVL